MIWGATKWLLLGLFVVPLLLACGSYSAKAPVIDRGTTPIWTPKYHRVKSGDTLVLIAWRYGKDVSDLIYWNHLKAPYTIYPNNKIILSGIKAKKSSVSVAKSSLSKTRKTQYKPKKKIKKPIKNNTFNYIGKVKWQWPVEGRLLRKYNKKTSGKKGIAIAGKPGIGIKAAAKGRVVYSGTGLVGYGRLIIVMHSKTYLSAYAHNSKLLVKEGDLIKIGQKIALMGNSGTQRTMLHFEIRRNGKAVDPLRYLPRR